MGSRLLNALCKDLTFATAARQSTRVHMKLPLHNRCRAAGLPVAYRWSLVPCTNIIRRTSVDKEVAAACDWQLNAVTDVPTILPLVFGSLQENPLQVFESRIVFPPVQFSFSPSRAPPAAPA